MSDPVDMSLFRKALLTVFLVSLTGSAFGAGTFATFSASTTNAGSTFATGTIVLSNQKNAETACISTGPNSTIDAGDGTTDDNDNAFGCSSLFSVNLRKPGDTATVDLTLQNVGTLNATTLEAFRSAACTSGTAAGSTYTGSADMCANTRILVEEYDDAARTDIDYCWYGGSIGDEANCTSSAAHTLATFSTAYTAAGSALALTGGLTASETRYFRITLLIDSTAGNSVMGRQATFGFTWRIDQ